MLKSIIIAAITIVSTTIGIYTGYQSGGILQIYRHEKKLGLSYDKIEYLNFNIFALPILENNNLIGYFIIRFSVGFHQNKNMTGIDEETFFSDLFYQAAFNSRIYMSGETGVPDTSFIADFMLKRANEFFGSGQFESILIQQIDYFDRAEVRKKNVVERVFAE